MAQLQERVKELEEDIKKKGAGSLITITRSHLLDDNDTAMGEMNTKECYRHNETFPELEVRVLGKEVLIKIRCGKQKEILVNIILQLQILHLSITTTNVLPFGNTLNITIIAQASNYQKNKNKINPWKKITITLSITIYYSVSYYLCLNFGN